MNSIKEKVLGKHVSRFVLFLGTTLYLKVHLSIGTSDFKKVISTLATMNHAGATIKVDDQELQALLDENSCQTEKQLVAQLGVTQKTVSYRLKAMGKIRKGTTWVPHFLTQENKKSRLDICLNLHNKQHRKTFLWKFVTGDEKWIYFDNPKHKYHWVTPASRRHRSQSV